ncbi:NAD-dependent epimerase/dehydratase family protein [Longimicrobium terrae]|uniref:UDP-glucuronate 4-epimerase n=1 Tax=Longimicrobium terrae TaxID=1639882 RepID=A0A841GQV3_9BACT|nr:NAD-dependent epimerase/dehydratase family protein [Longimicrobium terrae]MBB4634521.1 UDP-glucuronate 4-epimerase [Longimicrobium terrae]MBB6068589.1 UDP-glucuronate 4-epimerase [Longimicrobium terrae]
MSLSPFRREEGPHGPSFSGPAGSPLRVVVTGGAGFIGSHLCQRLLDGGGTVWAVDNFDPFYDPAIKRAAVRELEASPRFRLVEADVCDEAATAHALEAAGLGPGGADVLIHLAARAGVRPSIEDPAGYARFNVQGTAATLELSRRLAIPAYVFGSSSSVYGNEARVPFREDAPAASPISPYAATKRAGELLCHAHHHLYGTSVVCLRFFTVYGPRQRPDLAIHKFARLMAAGEAIPLFGDGSTARDYTFVDDIVHGVEAAARFALARPGAWEILNLGGSQTVTLARLVELLAGEMGIDPAVRRLPAQPGDVERTWADIGRAGELLGYAPGTSIEAGIAAFVRWFRDSSARSPRSAP